MLKIHFLNVGHGDCTIVEHPSGRLTMIDINNSQKFDSESRREFLTERRVRELAGPLGGLGSFASSLALPGTNGLLPLGGLRNQRFGGALARALDLPARPSGLGSLGELLLQIQEEEEAEKQELTDPIEYMRRRLPGQKLFRFILTHPDLDHMRGLKRLYEEIGFINFWDISHDKSIYDFRSEEDQADWEFYQRLRTGRLGVIVQRRYRGEEGFAWNQDPVNGGDGIEIMSPTVTLADACRGTDEFNDASYVLRLHHAGRSIIIPGDVEEPALQDLVRAYGPYLKTDWLKAPHHGRDSGFHLEAVRLMAPGATVVSVGRKPDTDAHSKYHDQCGNVKSTRYHGNISLDIYDDGTWQWWVDRNPDI